MGRTSGGGLRGRGVRDTLDDAGLAASIAQGAGELLVAARHDSLLEGRLLGDMGDALAQAWIAAVLRRHRPGDAVLSEEARDTGERLGHSGSGSSTRSTQPASTPQVATTGRSMSR